MEKRQRVDIILKKLVIKTAIITLISIIALGSFALGVTALFFPKGMAKVCEFVGAENGALKNYVKVYEKTKDIDDLFVIVNKSVVSDESQLELKYIEKFVKSSEFEEYVNDIDNLNGKPNFTTKEFVLGLYVENYFYVKGIADAVYLAQDLVLRYGYTEYNAFSALLLDVSLDAEQKERVKMGIEQIYSSLNSDGKAFADRDLALIG